MNEALRAATADPPPTSIDLDRLIRGERRRTRQQRWLAGVGVAAGAVVLVGAASRIPTHFANLPSDGTHTGGPAPGCVYVSPPPSMDPDPPIDHSPGATVPASPHVSQSLLVISPPSSFNESDGPSVDLSPGPSAQHDEPRPTAMTESCGEALARLNGVLPGALTVATPRARIVSGQFKALGDGYEAWLEVRNGDKTGTIDITVEYSQTAVSICSRDCHRSSNEFGSVVSWTEGSQTYADSEHSNGTRVYIYSWRSQPLTEQEMAQLALQQGFSIFP